jgi:hypothetical protein
MGNIDFSGVFEFGAICFGLVIGLALLLVASLTGFWSWWLFLTLPVFGYIPYAWLTQQG